uniref:Ig-like domain-containing protein n=1 Tax=Lates calcarifer TaxID=8187 RepID=A0A4W6BRK8_LATCA
RKIRPYLSQHAIVFLETLLFGTTIPAYYAFTVQTVLICGSQMVGQATKCYQNTLHLSLFISTEPPDSVSIGFNYGQMRKYGQFSLLCKVHKAALVENLTVTFYRGQTALGQLQSNNTEKKPVTEILTLSINTSKEDDGVQYWCEAKLELGLEGPQPPLVLTSEKFSSPWTIPSTSSTPIPSFNVYEIFILEKSLGDLKTNGTEILWTVEKMTEWDPFVMCYYELADHHCCRTLSVTVYKPPDNVSISFRDHSGPLLEGHQYILQCEVHNVAPVENLTVTFYRGQTALGQLQSNNTEKKPVTEIFTLSINTRKEDDGVQYWCELDLGPEGPQPPPVVMSEKISATVNSTASGATPMIPNKPVFNPSRLVVKYGDPVSVTCSIRQSYQDYFLGLVNFMGNHTTNGTTILWEVENMTEWRTLTKCCHINATHYCCCSKLPITVYKPPDSVSFSFRDHSGPLLEGHQYTLQCEVHNVAPVENLTVTFYRGQTALGQLQSNNTEKTPVTEIFTLNINTSKEDDGVQYWCEAKLELGPEGPQPLLVVTSEKFSSPWTIPSTSSTPIPSFSMCFMLLSFSLKTYFPPCNTDILLCCNLQSEQCLSVKLTVCKIIGHVLRIFSPRKLRILAMCETFTF